MYVKWFSARVSSMWWLLVSTIKFRFTTQVHYFARAWAKFACAMTWLSSSSLNKSISLWGWRILGSPGWLKSAFPRTLIGALIKITSKQEMLRWWNRRQALNFAQIMAAEFIRLQLKTFDLLLRPPDAKVAKRLWFLRKFHKLSNSARSFITGFFSNSPLASNLIC